MLLGEEEAGEVMLVELNPHIHHSNSSNSILLANIRNRLLRSILAPPYIPVFLPSPQATLPTLPNSRLTLALP